MQNGELAEWLMAPVLKTGIPGRVSGVRIPHSPPWVQEPRSARDFACGLPASLTPAKRLKLESLTLRRGFISVQHHEERTLVRSINFGLLSRIYGLILVPEVVLACGKGPIPWLRMCGNRRIVWSPLEFCC